MPIKQQQKQDFVSKIKKSNTFKNAPTSIALLQYLFEATLKNTHLKEGVIEIEFFGNKETPEKNNPRVRVNVYNLRKKLVSYYAKEGKEDNWKIRIDKGQYKVRFEKKETESLLNKKIHWNRILPYAALIICFIIIIKNNTTPKTPELWQSFTNKNTNTNLFIGDHFGASGKTITGNTGWTRDFSINSVSEFYELIDKKPELKNTLNPSNYSYSTRMAALATQHLQRFYQYYGKTFNVKFSTQSSISEIKESNAIYVGPTKNGNKFVHFFNEANPYLTISDSSLQLNNHPSLAPKTINIKSNMVNEEYAVVSKYQSINNTEHFVFFSQHDIGVSATVEYFTNKDSLSSFKAKYLKNNDYFTAIFKVKGQDRTNTALKLETVIEF